MNEKKIELYLKNANSFLWGIFDHARDRDPELDRNGNPILGIKIDRAVYGLYQKKIYDEIQGRLGEKLFPWHSGKKVAYAEATKHLLDPKNLGISGILKKIILPYQAEVFIKSKHEMEFLKKCWGDGDLPSSFIIENYNKWSPNKIEPIHFYEANFVEYYPTKEKPLDFSKGWTQWAFVYFGELEPDPDPELKIEYYIKG